MTDWKPAWFILNLVLFFSVHSQGQASPTPSTAEPAEPLLVRNSFDTPEEVLGHFLRRDEAGAFWAGMLEPEMRAFTTWKTPPQAESYFRFKERKLGEARKISQDEVVIPVTLTVIDQRDAFGTRMPASARQNPHVQDFRLRRIDGQWKIVQPDSNRFVPALRVKSR